MNLAGIISDTHGLLRPGALKALRGVDHILHAGDVGKPEILDELRAIAPVTAVRGNVDSGTWASLLPMSATKAFGSERIHIRHILADLPFDPKEEGIAAVVSGHTHKPLIETRGGVLYINPGSAGPRRFTLPVSIGFLRFNPLKAWLQTLEG